MEILIIVAIVLLAINTGALVCGMAMLSGCVVRHNFKNPQPAEDNKVVLSEEQIRQFAENDANAANEMLHALANLNSFMTGEEVKDAEQQDFRF